MTVYNDSDKPMNVTLTIYTRVGASEVFNEIGQVVIPAIVEPIPKDADRKALGYATEAKQIVSLDLASALRQAADDLERQEEAEALRRAGGHL